MADDEEPRPQTLQERIAALNMGHVGRAPITAQPTQQAKRPVPAPPIRRTQTASIPTTSSLNHTDIGNEPSGRTILPAPEGIVRTGQKVAGSEETQPPKSIGPRIPPRTNTMICDVPAKPPPPPRLPPRDSDASQRAAPALPTRRPTDMARRDSSESAISTVSTITTASTASTRTAESGRIRAPAYDPATLPPLPPKRTQEDKERDLARIPLKNSKSTASVVMSKLRPGSQQQAPPLLPRRSTGGVSADPSAPSPPPRKMAPVDIPVLPPRRDTGANSPSSEPALPPRPTPNGLPTPESTPPPIPTATRPDLSKIMATKPKLPMYSSSVASTECLQCRDFSAADAHAAKFPRASVRSLDWLAQQLTSPFPSRTDKARAIFTWLHHNIDYDTVSFFNGTVKPATPQTTLSTGLAVCEGYAGLFAALATKAGLEAIVVGGHGKGFGYAPVAPGSPIPPPDPTGHAWSAVRLDNGDWKLLDACWGAGAVQGKGQPYTRGFTPAEFSRPNDLFGRTHFPANPAHFFLPNDATVSWADYIRGDVPGGGPPVEVFSDVAPREGFDKFSFHPRQRHLNARALGSNVRFGFSRVCPHWDPLRNGPGAPYAYVLALAVPDGGKAGEMVPFANDGRNWWLDIEPHRLGKKGDKVFVYAVTTVGGQDARGIPWDEKNFFKGMGWNGVAMWEVL